MAKNVWDEFKDLFKTDSQKSEDRKNQINDALEREKQVTDKLAELEREYNGSLPKDEIDIEKLFPSDTGLREIEYSVDSDEDIAERAMRENSYNKRTESNNLNDKYATKVSALDESKRGAEKNLGESYRQLQELYDQLRERAENDTLKRGLARSSIAATTLGDLDSAKLRSAGQLRASYDSTINDINTNIAKLEAERETALDELDLKYAVELDERIAELKADRDKTVQKNEEYNANVRKQNDEYARKREENIADYLKKREKEKLAEEEEIIQLENKYGYTGAKQENYAKRYDIAYDFYASLAPEIAVDALEASPNMKYYLGAYYDKLLKALKSSSPSKAKYF